MSNFQSNPWDYALQLVECGQVDELTLLTACLKYMSHDDVRGMLSANELSPSECGECGEIISFHNELCENCQQFKQDK